MVDDALRRAGNVAPHRRIELVGNAGSMQPGSAGSAATVSAAALHPFVNIGALQSADRQPSGT